MNKSELCSAVTQAICGKTADSTPAGGAFVYVFHKSDTSRHDEWYIWQFEDAKKILLFCKYMHGQ